MQDKKLLLITRDGKELSESGKPLVKSRREGMPPAEELAALEVDSMMVMRLEAAGQYLFLGICNGRDRPEPYLSEDVKFLDPLLRILSKGIKLGQAVAAAEVENAKKEVKAEAEKEQTHKHLAVQYGWARVTGGWNFLASASRDFARSQLHAKGEA